MVVIYKLHRAVSFWDGLFLVIIGNLNKKGIWMSIDLTQFWKPAIWFERGGRVLLSFLLLLILSAMGLLLFNTSGELIVLFGHLENATPHHVLRTFLVDFLSVLALVEVFRTVLVYFAEGRVKVTYIIDTVLVVVLTEVMGFWYMPFEAMRVLLMIALVLVLMGVRIMAIRFSPRRRDLSEGL